MRSADEVKSLFAYAHLPSHLQAVSEPFYDIALDTFSAVGPTPAVTKALWKLWEAKNLVVWQKAQEVRDG